MWGCFLMSGVKILHVLKDWWKSIPIHQNYTMALSARFWFLKLSQYSSNVKGHLQKKSVEIWSACRCVVLPLIIHRLNWLKSKNSNKEWRLYHETKHKTKQQYSFNVWQCQVWLIARHPVRSRVTTFHSSNDPVSRFEVKVVCGES